MNGQDSIKTSIPQAVFAACALGTVGLVAHALWLVMTGDTGAFVQRMRLENLVWFPPGVDAWIDSGPSLWTAITASLWRGLHLALALLSGLGLTAGGYVLWRTHLRAGTRRRQAPDAASRELLQPGPPGIRPVVITPLTKRTIGNVAPPYKLHLKRSTLRFNHEPRDALERLEKALLEVLHAHREWPADPAGHHASANLYDHSRSVARRLRERLADNPPAHRLARAIGLGHDIGKILAYTRTPDHLGVPQWTIRDKQHDQLSAYIVYSLPEVHELDPTDRQTIITVLRYTHQAEAIPQQKSGELVLTLLRALKREDGLVTRDEAEDMEVDVDRGELIEALREALWRTIPHLNINRARWKKADAEGFTQPTVSYVAVQEQVLRKRIEPQLSRRHARALGMAQAPNPHSGHPAMPFIREALEGLGLLITTYDGTTSHNGVFSLRSGNRTFDWLFLLDRDAMAEHFADSLHSWGGWEHTLKVLTNRRPKAAPRDDWAHDHAAGESLDA